MTAFVARDGRLVSIKEAYGWLKKCESLVEQGDYEEALAQAFKALSWFQTAGASSSDEMGMMVCSGGEGVCLSRIGSIHAAQQNWEEAARYFKQSRVAFGSAWHYEEQSMTDGNAKKNLYIATLNLALAYAHLKQYQESLELTDAALIYYQEMEDMDGQISALRLAGGANAELGRKKAAVENFKSAAHLARTIGDSILEKELLKLLNRASK